ncbi:glucose receptor git3 protein [Purpureocillium lavendulum]|uniref:Glucose receptor git3 protein n=1 Tax=Purpureocillium lavendulum TaxID=1247861 RepID=A0AB34FBC3_9HYPO|nr:glucose receptor git3 protein [Purpureocillium lavendulum]
MAESKPIDHVIAIPTFIGSLLSFLGSATALVFQIARPPRHHFRHSLIVNLLLADFIYGLGNTVSGATFLIRGRTPSPLSAPDTACRVSGWFSQSDAQAVDFNILIISIIVLLSVLKKDSIAHLSMNWQIVICISAWIPGFITGTVGLLENSYGYVSGNWCWIRSNRLDLRYALSHGWRIAIFFITILIYTYVYFKLRKVFKNLRSMSASHGGTCTGNDNQAPAPSDIDNDTQKILVNQSISVSHEMQPIPRTPDVVDEGRGESSSSNDYNSNNGTSQTRVVIQTTQISNDTPFEASRMPAAPNVKKMLLMNGYPLAYIILWIPGIANRLAESVGGSPRWLSALQASTQYIGLINAMTYGMNEQMRRGVWKRLKDPSGRGNA